MDAASDQLSARLQASLRRSPAVMAVLHMMRAQHLPDPLLVSGAVYQTVWNDLTGRPCDYGIKDYDVGYFDADISYEAEDRVIARVADSLDRSLRARVEVRNQARVHLWFSEKFGHPYPPLTSTAQALERFVCPAFSVGVRLGQHEDEVVVVAPFGLADVYDMRLRVNPSRGRPADWSRIVESAVARWPELTVEDPS